MSKLIFLLSLGICFGCGGGAQSSSIQPPPPPAPDFTIALSSSSVVVSQGGTSPAVNISVNPQNGFTGSIQISLSGLPSGVNSNPASPFSIAAGSTTAIVFGASSFAAAGTFTISAQGTSNSLSHSASLSLDVQSSPTAALPRTMYARTNSIAALDAPLGEPPHRHLIYDPAHKRVFIANRAMNRVEVYSTVDQTRVAQINVPGASSADLSTDGSTVWVGTLTQQAIAIDASSLSVKSRTAIPQLVPVPNTTFERPEELLALSNGKLMMRLRQPAAAEALLALWDPASNALTNLTSAEPQLFQNGVGPMARSGDRSKILVATNDSSGELAVFDVNGNVVAGPHGLGAGVIALVAANPDASRFAVVFVSNGVSQLSLLDSSLNPAGGPVVMNVSGIAFSRDGSLLYASETAASFSAISIFDGQSLVRRGQVPDLSIQGINSRIEDSNETQLLFGIANRGVSFIDTANSVPLPAMVPAFASAPVAQPSSGPIAGETMATLTGQNFSNSAQVKFGTQISATVNVNGPQQIQALSPPSIVNGGVNLTAYFAGGWLTLAPDAFSYGPQILEVLPNAGSPSGSDAVQIYGYGFGSDAGNLTVSIGGAGATVQKIDDVASIASSLGFDTTYPFSLQRITLKTPPGISGKADVVVASPAGSATSAKAFQYWQSSQVFSHPALYKFELYDQSRQWIYLSAVDHVDVFDLAAGAFHAAAISPPGGPPPNADLRGMSLTPDNAQLVVADFGAQSIYLVNPDNSSGLAVPVGGIPGFANSGPSRVAATNAQTVFVALSAEGTGTGGCTSCLAQLDLTASPPALAPAPQPEVSNLVGAPLLQGNSAGDQIFAAFSAAPTASIGVWNSSAPNNFAISPANESVSDIAASSDGTMFAVRAGVVTEIRNANLVSASTGYTTEIEQIPGRTAVPGIALHPSGALIYQPFLTGPAPAQPSSTGVQGGVDILDSHSGALRLRLFLPEPLAMLSTDVDGLHGSFLAVDENGQRIFALTTSGLTVVQLANVPLGIGTISSVSVPASGGATLTIRGSGFQSGTKVMIGGKSAVVTFKDMNTLSVVTPATPSGAKQIIVTNPDGETVSLDAALTAN